jgi:Ran GTPase-activating protein (RanGAP) involved in mRNA processing and transport
LHVTDLSAVARSAHLKSLTHLRFQKSDAGDEGVETLIDSGLLGRLKFLDLAMGTITDAGAELLAAAGLEHLEVLDVTQNRLSETGQGALRRAMRKRTLRGDGQVATPNPEWVYWGEME